MFSRLLVGDPIKGKKGQLNRPSQNYLQMPCPKCHRTNTIKMKLAHSAVACPWCKHFFTPSHSEMRYSAVAWNDSDSVTSWDDI